MSNGDELQVRISVETIPTNAIIVCSRSDKPSTSNGTSLMQISKLGAAASSCSLFWGYMLTASVTKMLELYDTINSNAIKQLQNVPFGFKIPVAALSSLRFVLNLNRR